ncbi:tetratricopeptide repeat protein [Ruegeria sp. SCP11]|uniref:tetratricopeptide repeat protein n=1 Tax=Ruegeria sp. SCP11 TaxID=3141378 RepID=UPI00333DBF94
MNRSNDLPINQHVGQPSPELVREALSQVVSSDGFQASPRLRQFLTYIVEETLSGRSNQIRGKAIAVEVYERRVDGTGGQNLVRVEARRLRRLLHQFYEDQWDGEGVRIFVDPGGYKPRFSYEAKIEDPTSSELKSDNPVGRWRLRQLLPAGLGVIAVAVVFGVWLSQEHRKVLPTTQSIEQAERAALGEQSLTRLQAANLADQARGMFFPVFDVKRQQIALGMFQHAMELDPALSDGYAGSAQVLAILAVLSPDEAQRDDLFNQASEMSGKALELSPADAWANSANGWVLAAKDQPNEALKYARMSVELAPKDGHILDLAGITAIMANAPALAAEVSNPERPRSGSGRFGARNIWGVSQLMLGNYEDVIDAFQGAPAAGAPVSAPSLLFQAVAQDLLGNSEQAQRLVNEMRKTWPEFPSEFLAERIFQNDGATRNAVFETLKKY